MKSNWHNNPSWLPNGYALMAYWNGNTEAIINIHMEDGSVTKMPIGIYFRKESELPHIEKIALSRCYGKVMDVGAGVGAHSLILQSRGFSVTGLDIAKQGVEIMKKRGLKHTACDNFITYSSSIKYDTLLFLMNGIGICASLQGLSNYLEKASTLLSNQGQIILDSSDLRNGEIELDYTQDYFGVFKYQLEYNGHFGKPYNWLYIDQETLQQVATAHQFDCEIIYEQEDGGYLARLIKY